MLKPKALRRGDRVAVVSLSRGLLGEENFIHKYTLAKERLMKDYGLELVAMPNALRGVDYLYAHPEARARDLLCAFEDPEIRAVICAIGGDDTIRLLPYIDFEVLHRNPKIFMGFSDTTVNHFMMQKAGLVSYYGGSLMCNWSEYTGINAYTQKAFHDMLFAPKDRTDIPCSTFCCTSEEMVLWCEENMQVPTPRRVNNGYEVLQGHGKARGVLLGGCADVFIQLLGTPLWPSLEEWKGKLLLLETSNADMSAEMLTWVLRNLQAQGILSVLNGILVGKPCVRNKYEAYKAVFRSVVGFEARRPDLPILYNVNVGHAYPIGLFPLGLSYEVDCERRTLTLLETATEG